MTAARGPTAKMQKKMLGLSVKTDYVSSYGMDLRFN
jgi:hypoxanthine-guanine phosphoribosyltransferase